MADKSGIEWTDASWNPVTGCTKVTAGCKNCYAKHQAWPRLSANPRSRYYGRKFEDVQTHSDRDLLLQPVRWTRPRRVFVNSMSDLFHEAVPFEFIDKVFAVMAMAPQHIFQVLTKRPERMREWSMRVLDGKGRVIRDAAFELDGVSDKDGERMWPGADWPNVWPLPNVWLGVSVEDQEAWDYRAPILLSVPAAVRWISAEPLLGPVDMKLDRLDARARIDWVVVGGESGSGARPMHPVWADRIRAQCEAHDVAFLFKQWGEWAPRSGVCAGGGTSFSSLDPECKKWPNVVRMGERGRDTHDLANVDADMGEEVYMQRVGKKLAGRALYGCEYDGYPVTSVIAQVGADA